MIPTEPNIPPDSETPEIATDRHALDDRTADEKARPGNPDDWSIRRASFRCCIQPDQQQALLIKGRSRYPVRLVNQSAGGFRVELSASASFQVGELLRLQRPFDLAEVRVAYVQSEGDTTQIGLAYRDRVKPRSNGFAVAVTLVALAVTTAALAYRLL